MVPVIVIAVFGAFLFPGLLYYEETRGKKIGGLVMKVIASSTFVVLGIVCARFSPDPAFAKYIVIGEIFGAVGDVIIHLGQFFEGSMIPFCLGGAAFMGGHIAFILGLARVSPDGIILSVILTAVLFAAIMILLCRLTETDRVMRILTSIYMLTVSAFAAFSLAAFIAAPAVGRGILAAGSLVFLFSDFDLMLHTMGRYKWKFVFPCMYVYYPAQIITALSLYFFL